VGRGPSPLLSPGAEERESGLGLAGGVSPSARAASGSAFLRSSRLRASALLASSFRFSGATPAAFGAPTATASTVGAPSRRLGQFGDSDPFEFWSPLQGLAGVCPGSVRALRLGGSRLSAPSSAGNSRSSGGGGRLRRRSIGRRSGDAALLQRGTLAADRGEIRKSARRFWGRKSDERTEARLRILGRV